MFSESLASSGANLTHHCQIIGENIASMDQPIMFFPCNSAVMFLADDLPVTVYRTGKTIVSLTPQQVAKLLVKRLCFTTAGERSRFHHHLVSHIVSTIFPTRSDSAKRW